MSEKPPPPTDENRPRWNVPEAIASWIIPGLGHYMIGERSRGVILGVTIMGVWLAGFLIGGVSTFDRREHTAWFVAQALIAPSIVAEQWHQRLRGYAQPLPPQSPDEVASFEPSYGRVNEQAILYTALAGLLNLLIIFDIVHRDPRHTRESSASAENDDTPKAAARAAKGASA